MPIQLKSIGSIRQIDVGNGIYNDSAPLLVPLANGRIAAIYNRQSGSESDLSMRFLSRGGVPLSDEIALTNWGTWEDGVSAAALPDGGFALVWRALDSGSLDPAGLSIGTFRARFDASGAAVGTPTIIPDDPLNNQAYGDVTLNADGKLVWVWHESSGALDPQTLHIRVEGGEEAILPDGSGAGALFRPRIITRADGGLQLIWAEGGNDGTYQVLTYGLTSDGVPIGAALRLDDSERNAAVNGELTLLSGGRMLASWTESRPDGTDALMARILDTDGTPVSDILRLSEDHIRYSVGGSRSTALAATADGGFAAAWIGHETDGRTAGILLQRFDAEGTAVTDAAWVSQPGSETNYGNPTIAVSNDGRITVGWVDAGYPATFHTRSFAALLVGTAANDTLDGSKVNDRIYGRDGDDLLVGSGGADVLEGDEGNDVLRGGAGNDRIRGGNGNDTLDGGSEDDILDGGMDSDLLRGRDGDDLLKGGNQNDTLQGDTGNDTLDGGRGADVLTGGDGADVFVFSRTADMGLGRRTDVIRDFQSGEDLIDLSRVATGFDGADFSGDAGSVRLVLLNQRASLEIDIDGDRVADVAVILQGVTALDAGDLLL